MAKTTITLTQDEKGNPHIILDHKSDPDALPHEHDEEHAKVLKKLSPGKGTKVSRAPSAPVSVENGGESTESKEAVKA